MALDWMPFCLKIFKWEFIFEKNFDTWYFLSKRIHEFYWLRVLLCHSFNLFSFDNTLLSEDFSNENLFLRKHFGIFGQNFINWVLLLHWDLIFVFFNTVIWEFFKWEFIFEKNFNTWYFLSKRICIFGENSDMDFVLDFVLSLLCHAYIIL